MRFTLDPGGDIEVPEGLNLGSCRPALVRLTGSAALADATLRVDGRVLADDHPAGITPWVHGSRLTSAAEPDLPADALTAPWHLAVLSGPDAGRVGVPAHDGTVRVGRAGRAGRERRVAGGSGGETHRGRLEVHDPTVSREHLVVRFRNSRPGRPETWLASDLGSANGSTLIRAGRGREQIQRLGRRARRLRPGDTVRAGATAIVVVRGTGAGAESVQHAGPGGGRPGGAGPAGTPRSRGSVPVSTWLVPAVASLALAAATRNPIFLLFAMSGPLGLALPELLRSSRDRDRLRPQGHPTLGDGPAAASLRLAAHRQCGGASTTAARAQPMDDPTGQPPAWWPLAHDGLALVGPRDALLAAARGLLGVGLLDQELQLAVLAPPSADPEWAWCRWLGRRLGSDGRSRSGPPAMEGGPDVGRVARDGAQAEQLLASWSTSAPARTGVGRQLVVADGLEPWRPELTRWWSARADGTGLLLLLDEAERPPAWCRHVLRCDAEGQVLTGETIPTAPFWWIEQHARRIAGMDHAPVRRGHPHRTGGDLPARVALVDLDLPDDLDGVLRAWRPDDRPPALVTAIGVGIATPGGSDEGAVVLVDLLAEGPHALVAGTTGAGKSELLQSMLLGLALSYPPTRLAMVLVDYKGGASFGRCADLPHVVGQVTDLDQVEAARALDGLRAEMRRRERLLAEHGLGDLETLRQQQPSTAPPRLLVVVDEFRALAEDLPDFVPGLVRLSAQGRSLGIHLVLATQRPAGAVSAQMRANVGLRLCLRVTDAADSVDVVEVPDAAGLAVDRPGRALLRRGPAEPEVVQTAWAALGRGYWRRASPHADPALVRWASGWEAWSPSGPGGSLSPVAAAAGACDHTAALVQIVRQAAAVSGMDPPARVWLPPLPAALSADDLPAPPPRSTSAVDEGEEGLPLGMTDLPVEQNRGVLTWRWSAGPLVVAGRAGSGRTTTLGTITSAALARGWHVHLVVGDGSPLGQVTHPGLGTVVGPDDPRRLARLLTMLATPATGPVRLLVVDDWGAVSAALDRVPRGAGVGLLEPLLRDGRHHGLVVAVSGTPADLTRLLPYAGERLVLPVADPHDDALMGVPRALAGRQTPGRAAHVFDAGAVRCQVAMVGSPRLPLPVPTAGPAHRPLLLLALPLEVDRSTVSALPPVGAAAEDEPVVVGRGGDDAAPLTVAAARGVLVVGPAGSGRSTALATLALGLRARGRSVVVVARAGPLARVGSTEPTLHARTADQAHRLLGAPSRPGFVLVDDLDSLARTDSDLDELLAGWAVAAETGDPDVPRVLASARTDRAAAAYRGAMAALRGTGEILVLAPSTAGSSDVAGVDLSLWIDPTRPLHPGRGVLVHRGQLTGVQVSG